MLLISGINIQADALIFQMVNDALFLIDLNLVDLNFQHHFQKFLTIFFVYHNGAKEKVILDCQFL